MIYFSNFFCFTKYYIFYIFDNIHPFFWNMDRRTFYGKKTKVSILAEVCEIIEQSSDFAAIVVLPPAAGDAGDQDSDIEEISDNPEEEYEPGGELEVEKDIESGSGNEILPH